MTHIKPFEKCQVWHICAPGIGSIRCCWFTTVSIIGKCCWPQKLLDPRLPFLLLSPYPTSTKNKPLERSSAPRLQLTLSCNYVPSRLSPVLNSAFLTLLAVNLLKTLPNKSASHTSSQNLILRNPFSDPSHDTYILLEEQDNKWRGKSLVVIKLKE